MRTKKEKQDALKLQIKFHKRVLCQSTDDQAVFHRQVEHRFNCDGKLLWYKGTVLGFNKVRNEFRILYDDEEEWTFQLLEDLERDDLRIVG